MPVQYKYSQTTATSDPVTVTLVKGNAFEAKQTSITEFNLEFDHTVEKLAKADVTVQKVTVRNDKEYYTRMTVKDVKLNDAKDTATVILFAGMEDATNYKITVAGIEESYVLTASKGKPVRLVVTAQVGGKDLEGGILTTGEKATLVCKFYDANEVDVTDAGYKATYTLEEYSKNNGYSLNNGELTIRKSSEVVGVKAKYQKYENGKLAINLNETFYFAAVDPTPIYITGVVDFSVNGVYGNGQEQTLQVGNKTGKYLSVKVATDDGKDPVEVKANNATLDQVEGKPSFKFTAIDPQICNITSTGMLIPYKTGTAGFYVYAVYKDKNNKVIAEEPIGDVYVDVKKDAEFAYFTLDKYSVYVGSVAGYDSATIKATLFDQYDAKISGNAVTIEGVTDNAKKVIEKDADEKNAEKKALGLPSDGSEQTITIKGANFVEAVKDTDFAIEAGSSAEFEFKVKAGNIEQFFSVNVQVPSGTDNYVAVENNNVTDALRVVTDKDDDTKAAKKLTFSVYQMNNGIKIGIQNIQAYPSDASAISASAYYYKLTKDGNALPDDVVKDKNYVSVDSNSVSITLSGTSAAASGSAIGAGKTVDYNKTGAGTYVFELYLGSDPVDASSCTVTVGDKGEYTLVGQESNEVTITADHNISDGYVATDKAAIVKCFKINGRDGKVIDLTAKDDKGQLKYKFDVKYDAAKDTGSVYVESITVYESVAEGEYVAYEIPVNVVLVRK